MAEGRTDLGPIAKFKLNGLITGKGAVEWMQHRLQDVVHGAQQSVTQWTLGLEPMNVTNGSSRVAPSPREDASQVVLTAERCLEKEMEAWRRNSFWVDEKPVIDVTVPKGVLCQVNSQFKIGIPPDAVYNVLIDPGNRRVFENIEPTFRNIVHFKLVVNTSIVLQQGGPFRLMRDVMRHTIHQNSWEVKEVKYRKVLEDDGERQLVEVEQAACWRFLWFSGTLNVCVVVDQDRRTNTIRYKLAKQGFMKQFEGSWRVQPLFIDKQGSPTAESDADRVASVVFLQQVVQPALVPPPPFKGYVRGITTKTTEVLMENLQAEGRRLRESTGQDLANQEAQNTTEVNEKVVDDPFKFSRKLSGGRRKSRMSRWRLKDEST